MTNPAADPLACDLFEFAPISLWEEDYAGVKAYLDQLAVADCMARIQMTNINRKTVELFRAGSKRELVEKRQHH